MKVPDRWSPQIDEITSDFKHTFGKLSLEELNWRPSPKEWSVAQNIDHLMVINNTYFQRIESLRANEFELPSIAKVGFMVKFLGKMILNSVKPDRKKRIKTFDIWEPSQTLIDSGILKRFDSNQATLKKTILECSYLLERNAVISSPANRMIVLRLEAAFDIIVSHERRHFEQASEVLERQRKVNSEW